MLTCKQNECLEQKGKRAYKVDPKRRAAGKKAFQKVQQRLDEIRPELKSLTKKACKLGEAFWQVQRRSQTEYTVKFKLHGEPMEARFDQGDLIISNQDTGKEWLRVWWIWAYAFPNESPSFLLSRYHRLRMLFDNLPSELAQLEFAAQIM